MSDVLNICSMDKSILAAGSGGLNNIVYNVKMVSDYKTISEITEGTFLLITSNTLALSSAKEFITACSMKKVAGIGIKKSEYDHIAIDEIVNLANGLNIPLINIVPTTSFSSIVSEIFNLQSKLTYNFQKIYDKLMDLMLNGANIEKIVDVLAQIIEKPILISLEIPKSEISNFHFIEKKFEDTLLKSARTYNSTHITDNSNTLFQKSAEFIDDAYVNKYVKAIVINNISYGHLFIWSFESPLDSLDFSIINNILVPIQNELVKKVSVLEIENSHKKNFLDNLLSKDLKTREKALEITNEFHLDRDNSFIAFSITLEKNQSLYSTKKQLIPKLFYYVENLIRKKGIIGLVANDCQSVYFILSFNQSEDIKNQIEDFCKSLENTLIENFQTLDYKIGVGRCYEGLENVRCSYEEAKNSIGIGNRLNKKSMIFYDKLGVYTLLCHDGLNNELELFYNNTIKKLVDHDKKKSTELVKTLEVYFQCNGNLNKIAKVLFTHYNTILYRINRINEITGMDIKNEENRLNLEIALRIMHMLKVPC
ncbi:helix-turn-helix domain-containing protein [Clostridium cellulovorans]|nr:helix-turn-helix domain-containing protein [Clostridium cellulovorans]